MMSKKELVSESINLREPQAIPYTLYIDKGLACSLGEEFMSECEQESHTVRILWEIEDKKYDKFFIDPFGVRWDISRSGDAMYRGDFFKEPDVNKIPKIELITEETIEQIKSIRHANPDKFIYFQFTTTLSGRLAAFRGMENYLMDLILNPVFIQQALEKLLQMHFRAIDKLLKLPVDAIVFGDDFGTQKGLMISPESFRKIFKPIFKKITEKIRNGGRFAGVHCCGDATDIMADYVDVGIQFFHPLQPECMDIAKMKKEYGKHLAFRGGIGVQGAISYGTPEEARQEVRNAAKILSKGGGYLMETTKYLLPNVPPANVKAVVDEMRKVSGYRF